MTASSTTTHTLRGSSFTVGELRAYVDRCQGANAERRVNVSVSKGDRPNEPDTFILSVTVPEVDT